MHTIEELEPDETSSGYEVDISKIGDELEGFLDRQHNKLEAKVAVVDVEHFEEENTVDPDKIFPAYRFLEFAAKNSNVEVLDADEDYMELVFRGDGGQLKRMYEDGSWSEEFEGISAYHSWNEIDVMDLEEYREPNL